MFSSRNIVVALTVQALTSTYPACIFIPICVFVSFPYLSFQSVFIAMYICIYHSNLYLSHMYICIYCKKIMNPWPKRILPLFYGTSVFIEEKKIMNPWP
jgi:hypothetical protein